MSAEVILFPLWAHVFLMVAALAMCAFVAERGWRREDRLRRALGACRTSLHAAEIQRDVHRKESAAKQVRVAALLHELRQYRRSLPLEDRATQVMPQEPEPE